MPCSNLLWSTRVVFDYSDWWFSTIWGRVVEGEFCGTNSLTLTAMKKTLLLFSAVAASVQAMAQITIDASNHPVWGPWYQNALNPATGTINASQANGTWDVSNITPTSVNNLVDNQAETLPIFVNAGIDVYYNTNKSLNAQAGYTLDLEFDFNANGVDEAGLYVYQQGYDLSAYTGSTADSIKFPAQAILLSSPRRTVKFPMTYGTAWSWSSRRAVNFTLSVAAAGLVDAPCQHVFTASGTDTIVGYGKMRVWTSIGPSDYYDVLIKKNSRTVRDSFYIGGAPAPAQLLSAFNLQQNWLSSNINQYVVYRANISTPLAIINHTNSTFATAVSAYFDAENHQYASVEEASGMSGLLLYPNPVSGGVLNVVMLGQWAGGVNYEMIDLQGRVVKSGSANNFGGPMPIATDGLTTGNYLLKLIGHDGQTIQERFSIQD